MGNTFTKKTTNTYTTEQIFNIPELNSMIMGYKSDCELNERLNRVHSELLSMFNIRNVYYEYRYVVDDYFSVEDESNILFIGRRDNDDIFKELYGDRTGYYMEFYQPRTIENEKNNYEYRHTYQDGEIEDIEPEYMRIGEDLWYSKYTCFSIIKYNLSGTILF
jgi:hypothetical protein